MNDKHGGENDSKKSKSTYDLGPDMKTPQTPKQGNAAFTGRSARYAFSLPSRDWYRLDERETKEFGADIAVVHDDIGTIKIVISEWKLDPEDLYDGLEDAYSSEVRGFTRHAKGKTKMGAFDAAYIDYEGIDEDADEKIRVLTHCILHEGMLFQIIAIAYPAAMARMRKEVDVLKDSFTFAPDAATTQAATDESEERPYSDESSITPEEVKGLVKTGLTWGGIAAAVVLLLGIFAVSKGAGGKDAKLWFIIGNPLIVGILTASFRWGAIAANIGGVWEPLDKLIRGLIGIVFFPMRVMMFITLAMVGSILRMGSRDTKAMWMLTNGMVNISAKICAYIYGIIFFVLAGIPYIVYVSLRKKIRLNIWGYLGLMILGGFAVVLIITPFVLILGTPPQPASGRRPSQTQVTRQDQSTKGTQELKQGGKGTQQLEPEERRKDQGKTQPPPPQPESTPAPPPATPEVTFAYPSQNIGAVASSQLPNQMNNNYEPDNTYDKNMETAWSEGVPGNGVGQSITYEFSTAAPLTGIKIMAGYNKNENTFYSNHRLKRIRLSFDNSQTQEISLRDTREWQTVNFARTYITRNVKMTVLDVYPGNKFDDLAFSEIEFVATKPQPYLMVAANQRRIAERELDGKTATEVRLIRNEIFARHGRPFQTDWIRSYFQSQPWYRVDPSYSDSDNRLTRIELENVNLIQRYEQAHNF